MKIYLLPVALVLSLSGCGGGGGGGGGGAAGLGFGVPVAGNGSTSTLSDTQKNYESFAISNNGGLHYFSGNLSFSSSSAGTLSVNPNSVFSDETETVPQSPSNGVQPLSVKFTTVVSTLPAVQAPAGARYLIDGVIYSQASPPSAQVSYSGPNVLTSYFAADGKTITHSLLATSYTVVPLSGLISGSPSELFTSSAIGIITNSINGTSLYDTQASWQAGAAYAKGVRQYSGDSVAVGDCVPPTTTGPNVTPCSTSVSKLEGFFPHANGNDGVTYQIGDGQITKIAGVRAWISNKVIGNATAPTPTYRIYYEGVAGIYSGALIKDGTPIQTNSFAGLQSFYVYLNGTAAQSVQSAVKF